MKRCASAALAAAVLLTLTACQSTSPPGARETVAEVEGQPITVAEVDAWIKEDLFKEKTRDRNAVKLFEVRKAALASMVRERALEAEAARQGVDVKTLVTREAEALGVITDGEIEKFHAENRERLKNQELNDALRQRIRAFMEQARREQAMRAIESRVDVVVLLEPPRYEVAAVGPGIGPEDAPITIVEFSDFECPYCRRASNIVKEVRERYPEQVRVVYRQFPLERIHPRARPAAEASLCAADQDRFWDYHDLLFEGQNLSDAAFLQYARDLELDMGRFEACVSERTHKAQVDEDLDIGSGLGVTGTPAFFVNGIPLSGARPLTDFTQVIDSELERLQGDAPQEAQEAAAAPKG